MLRRFRGAFLRTEPLAGVPTWCLATLAAQMANQGIDVLIR